MSLDLSDDKLTLVQQAITWANVDLDLCHHMTSLGHNELVATGVVVIVFLLVYSETCF